MHEWLRVATQSRLKNSALESYVLLQQGVRLALQDNVPVLELECFSLSVQVFRKGSLGFAWRLRMGGTVGP